MADYIFLDCFYLSRQYKFHLWIKGNPSLCPSRKLFQIERNFHSFTWFPRKRLLHNSEMGVGYSLICLANVHENHAMCFRLKYLCSSFENIFLSFTYSNCLHEWVAIFCFYFQFWIYMWKWIDFRDIYLFCHSCSQVIIIIIWNYLSYVYFLDV